MPFDQVGNQALKEPIVQFGFVSQNRIRLPPRDICETKPIQVIKALMAPIATGEIEDAKGKFYLDYFER